MFCDVPLLEVSNFYDFQFSELYCIARQFKKIPCRSKTSMTTQKKGIKNQNCIRLNLCVFVNFSNNFFHFGNCFFQTILLQRTF